MLYSIVAENAIIGCCLINSPDVIDRIAAKLTIDDISEQNKPYFEAIFSLYADKIIIDVVTLFERLHDETAYGALSQMAVDVPTTENYYQYINTIKDKTKMRRLNEAAHILIADTLTGEDCSEGLQAMNNAIEQAQTTDEPQAYNMKQLTEAHFELIEKRYKKEIPLGMATGISPLDRLLCGGMRATELIIIASRPSVGKTSLMLQITRTAAKNGINTLIYSLETAKEKLMDRLWSQSSKIPLGKIRTGDLQDDDWSNLAYDTSINLKLQLAINDSGFLNIPKLRHDIKLHKPGLVAIDYLQLMQAITKENRTQQISEISRGLKLLAKDFNIPIICLSQLNRANELRTEKHKRPQLSDLRDGGSIEQDADVVMFLHKEDLETTTAEFIVAKNKDGQTGAFEMSFNGDYAMFFEIARIEGFNYVPDKKDKRGWGG